MLGTELENNVALSLVDSPSLVQTNRIDPNWFNSPKLSLLVKFVVDQHGDFANFVDLRNKFTSYNPTLMTDDDWQALANSRSNQFKFEGYVKELRGSYWRSQFTLAAQNASLMPSKENINKVKDILTKMQEPEDEPEASMEDLSNDLEYRLTHKTEDGILTYQSVDDLLNHGMHGGQQIVIGARPSVGKTAFSLNLIRKMFQRNPNMKADFFSLEMSAVSIHDRLAAALAEVNSKKFINPYSSMNDTDKAKARGANKVLNQYDLGIYNKKMSVEKITKTIRQRAAESQSGHYLAVVDYLQLVDTDRRMDKRSEIEYVSRTFKKLTTELNIPIILLSQLSRQIENRDKKIPVLSDLRETGAIEQDANVVGFLYRENEEPDPVLDPIVFNVQKNREGSLGKVRFNFYKPTQKMEAAL